MLTKTELEVYTILYAFPDAGNREANSDEGYIDKKMEVIYRVVKNGVKSQSLSW